MKESLLYPKKSTLNGTWKLVEVRGDTVKVELPTQAGAAQVSMTFENNDKCLYHADGEDLVMTRVP